MRLPKRVTLLLRKVTVLLIVRLRLRMTDRLETPCNGKTWTISQAVKSA